METDLRNELNRFDLKKIDIRVLKEPVASAEDARALAIKHGSNAVIWGWYDDLGVNVKILLTSGKQGNGLSLNTEEIPWELGGKAVTDISFVVREVLPRHVTFISLFVIGHIYYSSGNYMAAHKAFNAAMANIPETINFENEAVLHFFVARLQQANPIQNISRIICEYVEAIRLNPNFAEAYNNLGVIFSSYRQSVTTNSREINNCIYKINGTQRPSTYFEAALEIQPNSSIYQYNVLAMKWNRGEKVRTADSLFRDIQNEALKILQQDSSIIGLHIMLGNIAFDDNHYRRSIADYSSALKLAPKSSELLVNLGQSYLKLGQQWAQAEPLQKAVETFKLALREDPSNTEAKLALANLYYLKGLFDKSFKLLEAILGENQQKDGRMKLATILQSLIYVE